MRKLIQLLAMLLTFVVTAHTPAQAQFNHTWVATNGSDSNNCDRPTPCATFQGAFGKTSVGGEISCADNVNSAGGSLSINHSITVNCVETGGTVAGVAVFSTAATDVVILRGLDISTATAFVLSSGQGNLTFSGAGTLGLEKVRVQHMISNGIHANGILFAPSGAAKLNVSDSFITNNGGSGIEAGINITPNSGVQATVAIERTVINSNLFGIFADGTLGGTIRGTVTDCIVSGNTNNGISVNTNGTNVGLLVDNTKVSGNNYGLAVGGTNGLILVRRSAITANNTGLSAGGGGSLVTYRDNTLNNNSTDGAFSFAIPTQ